MPKTIEAIFEDGVFKPIKKVKLPEHERFKIILSPVKKDEEAIKRLVERQKKALLSIAGIGDSGLGIDKRDIFYSNALSFIKEFSFTDCTTFAVMERLKIPAAFTFDEHFRQYGRFKVYP